LLEDYWLSHIRAENDYQHFPRDFGIKQGGEKKLKVTRVKIYTQSQFLSVVKNNMSRDCYISVFSDAQIAAGLYDTIWLETDVQDFDKNLRIAESIKYELRYHDYRVYYTSNRSFHFFIDFEPILFKNYPHVVKKFCEQNVVLRNLITAKIIDTHGLGNVSALSRIPYTIHTKSGMMMYLCEIHRVQQSLKEGFVCTLKKLDGEAPDYSDSAEIGVNSSIKVLPRCVFNTLNELLEKHHLTYERSSFLAEFFIHAGWKDEQIAKLFSRASDYEEGYTMYQIGMIRKKNLKCHACSSLMRIGVCHSKCYLYPSVNKLFVGRKQVAEAS
jgi:hypothetical protein